MASAKLKETTFENTKLNVVPLELERGVLHQLSLVSASNVDQELGWTREEYKKIGVKYAFLRSISRERLGIRTTSTTSTTSSAWWPLPSPFTFRRTSDDRAPGGDACTARRRLLDGALEGRHLYEPDLKGKKIGLSKSLNRIKNDWWRMQETGHRADAPDGPA